MSTVANTTQTLRVLHVEDDFADAMLLQQALCDAGGYEFELEVVRTLGDAKRKLAKRQYDLIIVDLRLPDSIDPSDTVRTAEKIARGTPLLILTGSARVDSEALGGHLTILDKNEFFNGKDRTASFRLMRTVQDTANDALHL
ncbi:MAG: response regulator [Caulobacterales bacterium]|uniref:response regulator n=1 Tax=Glycocaulis sp. TaxID=1969725 RepID=UPI003F9F8F1B